MPEKRHIKIQAEISKDMKSVTVMVLEQTHISSNFGNLSREPHRFAHKWYILISDAYPNWYPESPGYCYLRGNDPNRNNFKFKMSIEEYQKFKAAVEAYNEFYK